MFPLISSSKPISSLRTVTFNVFSRPVGVFGLVLLICLSPLVAVVTVVVVDTSPSPRSILLLALLFLVDAAYPDAFCNAPVPKADVLCGEWEFNRRRASLLKASVLSDSIVYRSS